MFQLNFTVKIEILHNYGYIQSGSKRLVREFCRTHK